MRRLFLTLTTLLSLCATFAQNAVPVTQEVMDYVYQQSRTPYKYGMVVAPSTNKQKFDCPTVFRKGDKWLMTFVCYNGKSGTDGRGYETWLAESSDLLHWDINGRVLEYTNNPDAWDLNQRGGFPALIDYNWGGSYEMQQHKGKNYITYIGGSGRGYEAVEKPLSIGIASTDKDISVAHPWECMNKPLLSFDDKDAQWWEYMTQYKSTIYKMDKKWFGTPYVMFYNAGGKDDTHPKGERIGVALSKNMKTWKRYEGNPIFAHDSDGTITGDAQIVWMPVPKEISKGSEVSKGSNDGIWVMYYFSAFNPTREYNAYNTFAVSSDLIHWTDWNGADLIIPSKPYDEMFAHKSYVVKHDGVVYHFYCAVNNSEQRGIAVATSKPLGKSEVSFPDPDPTGKRFTINLNKDWEITATVPEASASNNSSNESQLFSAGSKINLPINLDDYYGTHQSEHGNFHGEATFTKHFTLKAPEGGWGTKRFFLRFEGVGTYADIALNGKNLGRYDIGRTVETIDATEAINQNGDNKLVVKVSHPSNITDMPWVCGGCSSEWGFSEGSQPFGIYRPVTLEITDNVRIQPFGTHIWANEKMDSVFVETEVKNYSDEEVTFQIVSKIAEKSGKQFARLTNDITLKAGECRTILQQSAIAKPILWTQEKPYLYTLQSMIKRNGKATDDYPIKFGFRSSRWPSLYYANYKSPKLETSTTVPDVSTSGSKSNQFLLNGSPLYINGVCEYEHLYGQSHAFQNEQIDARVKAVKDLGFNAFRDAHQPHNLRYGDRFQAEGILWWPQFSAHIWYDTPQFRESFKRHLIQWVKERRNNPAVVLWGLQNESTLPKDFAEECSDIIRQLDPTCGRDRLITTCNGGEGTDWNVVQNWSGTYGGNVNNYGNELKQTDQLLNGEYGAWRTLGNHSGVNYTEEKQADLLELKCQQAESVSDSICGQFLWLLNSHDNPGRRQPDEAYRRADKVGPYNYKGLVSPWEQPVSAYYMYKSRYTPVEKEPVCYIVRDIYNGVKSKNGIIDSLRIYSNCPEVVLAADGKEVARMQKPFNSTLFVFKNIKVADAALLKASGNGVYDEIALNNSETAQSLPRSGELEGATLRINCGGDACGNFIQDPSSYLHVSQTYDATLPVSNEIYKTARFGRHNLRYSFKVKKGETYKVKLHFIEPWYGASRSEKTDYEGFRIFDVAFNNTTVINDLDIWAQAGFANPYIRTINYKADADILKIHFPEVKAGQAIISAIEIEPTSAKASAPQASASGISPTFWSNLSRDLIAQMPDSLLPPKAATALQVDPQINKDRKGNIKSITYTYSVGVAKVYALRFRYWNGEAARNLHVTVKDKNGVTYVDSDVAFLQSQMKKTKRKMTSITTGTQTNAGTYTVTVTGEGLYKMEFDYLAID